jgi:hypothetical protein
LNNENVSVEVEHFHFLREHFFTQMNDKSDALSRIISSRANNSPLVSV